MKLRARDFAWLRDRPHLAFALEISVVVIVKMSFLYLLWRVFFAAPLAPHMKMAPASVSDHMLATPAAASDTPQHSAIPKPEENHAPHR